MTPQTRKRILEIIPAALVWSSLLAAVILSFTKPLTAIIFIIVFDVYWVYRVVYFTFYLLLSWRRFRAVAREDWRAKLCEVANYERITHLVFLPTYKEDASVLRSTFGSLARAVYPGAKLVVVLAGEERDRERFQETAQVIEREFAGVFTKIITTLHPANLPDEIPGKGSNLNWAGKRAQEYVDSLGLPYEDVIVSAFDVDTCVQPDYFAYLAYTYLNHPNPTRTSYQPIALYNNNMWESPAAVRVAAFGTTFWLMTEMPRPDRLFTFSSHSMSFRALVDVGFWQKDIVTEDSRIFLQCFFRYDGDYSVTPLYTPISMDTVAAGSYAKSLVDLYRQQRRWAWGIEHFPYMVEQFRLHPAIPFWKKTRYLRNFLEGMYSWATAPLLILILGRLPLFVAPLSAKAVPLFQNAPHLLDALMKSALAGLFISAIFMLFLLPPRRETVRRKRWLTMFAQWLLTPVTLIIFGSLPALDAQTRLALGIPLEFNVTKKARRQIGPAAPSYVSH